MRLRLVALAVLAAGVAVQIDGCAGHGESVRHLEDPLRHDPDVMEQYRLVSVTIGTRVVLALRDSGYARGRFAGVVTLGDEAYAERYAARLDTGLPPLGAPVSLERSRGREIRGTFQGFGFDRVRLKRAESTHTDEYQFDQFGALVDSGGQAWSPDTLTHLFYGGRMPVYTALGLRTEWGSTSVPLDRVLTVSYRHSSGRAIVGAVVIVSMVTAVVIIIHNQPRPRPRPVECAPTYYTLSDGPALREAAERLR